MSFDAYAICPCGSGKKMKFCCCKDILHDVEKVLRALDGDQRVAAVDLINRIIAEQGPRPALLTLLADCYLSLEDLRQCEANVTKLLATMPQNPVALALRATLDAVSGDVIQAVEHLQEALENTEQSMHSQVYTALGVVGTTLMTVGQFMAGRGHLMFQASLTQGKDHSMLETLAHFSSSPGIPLILKEDLRLPGGPPDAPWLGEFNAAMKSAYRGMWRVACESLESLNQKVPDQACVWRAIAILRSWLGDDDRAVAAWHKYAALPSGVSGDDAVEAEALANVLAGPAPEDMIDVVRLTYQVPDTDRLMEALLSDKRSEAMQVNLAELAEEGEPPPKAAFHIFDSVMPAGSDEVTSLQQMPKVIAEAFVYGRQTDRPARFEVILDRGRNFDSTKAEIAGRLAAVVGPLEKDDVIDQTTRVQTETSPKRQFPRNTDPARIQELVQEQRREVYLRVWPDITQSSLGGKSVRDAAQDPAWRNKALAAVLNLELANEEASGQRQFDFNELRRQLGLPERETTTIAGQDLMGVSLVRMGRVDYRQLSDDQLRQAYARVSLSGYRNALYRCGREILSRPSLEKAMDTIKLCQSIVNLAPSPEESLQIVEQGRQRTEARGQSPAPWLLAELQLRFLRLEANEINRIVQQLNRRHLQEPGVRDALFALLVRFGVLNPDGTVPGGQPPAGMAAAGPPAAAAPVPSGLWTPESPAPAPQRESKLWIPGSD